MSSNTLTATVSAEQITPVRVIPRSPGWLADPQDGHVVFGDYPLGSENYSFGAPYMAWGNIATLTGGSLVWDFALFGADMYAALGSIIHMSSDKVTWRARSALSSSYIASLHVDGTELLAGLTAPGAYIMASTNGITWSLVLDASASQNGFVSMSTFGADVYAGAKAGPLEAKVWRLGIIPAPVFTVPSGTYVWSLCVFGGKLYAGTGPYAGIHYSPDGSAWTTITPFVGITGSDVTSLAVFGSYLYAAVVSASDPSVWRTANGTTWTKVYSLPALAPWSLAASSAYIYVGASGASGRFVYRSANGTDWTLASPSLGTTGTIKCLYWNEPFLYAGIGPDVYVGREL